MLVDVVATVGDGVMLVTPIEVNAVFNCVNTVLNCVSKACAFWINDAVVGVFVSEPMVSSYVEWWKASGHYDM